MKDPEVKFIKGKFSYDIKRLRLWGKWRWALGVFKGERLIAIIAVHPCVKRPVLNAKNAMTEEALQFSMRFLDLRKFNFICRVLVTIQRAEDENGLDKSKKTYAVSNMPEA